MFDLYPHQAKVIEDLTTGFKQGHRRQVVALATGAGKTVVSGHLALRAAAKGRKALFVVDKIELARQAEATFSALGLRVGVLRAEDTDYTRKDDVVVASVQTIRSRSAPGWVDFVVVDEVHFLHAAHVRLLESWQEKVFVGLSATPLRRGLGRIFTNLVRGPSILALTEQGFLVPARAHVPAQEAIRAALAGVGCGTTPAGYDFREGELGAAMNQRELVGDLVRTWQAKAENRPTLAFATNIAHSKAIRDDFLAAGVSAAHIDAYTETRERNTLIRSFREGQIRILSSVAVLSVGFDVPDAACLILARPTLNLGLHIQQLGRGIRPARDKVDCLILDHAGNCLRHGLPHHFVVPDLDMGDSPDPARKKAKAPDPYVTCSECGFLMARIETTCPACGVDRPERINKIASREGELVAFGDATPGAVAPPQEDPREFYAVAKGWLVARAKNPKAAYFLTLARHPGCKPPFSWQDLPPLVPNAEQTRWIANRRRYEGIRRAAGQGGRTP